MIILLQCCGNCYFRKLVDVATSDVNPDWVHCDHPRIKKIIFPSPHVPIDFGCVWWKVDQK